MISYLLWIIEKFLQELYGHLLLSTSRKSIHLSVDEVSVEFFLKEKSICTYTEMVSLIISLEAMRMGFFLEFSSNVLLLLDPTYKMEKVFLS